MFTQSKKTARVRALPLLLAAFTLSPAAHAEGEPAYIWEGADGIEVLYDYGNETYSNFDECEQSHVGSEGNCRTATTEDVHMAAGWRLRATDGFMSGLYLGERGSDGCDAMAERLNRLLSENGASPMFFCEVGGSVL